MGTPWIRFVAWFQAATQRPSRQYFVVALGVVGITLLRVPSEAWLHGSAPFAFHFPLLAAVAWAFGIGPTLFAVASISAAAWYFILPATSERVTSAVAFLLAGACVVGLARAAAGTRRTVVRALEDSERAHVERERLAAIVSSSDDAIISKDLNGTILSWNGAAERVFGYRADEIVGQSILRLIPNERRFEEDHILMRLGRGERIEHFETVRVTKDGRELHISLSVSPIHDTSGRVVGASKIARDVTEQKLAQRAIVEQQELLRITLSNIADAVVTTDTRGAITYMNQVAERLSGVGLDEAKGRPLASVFRMLREHDRAPLDDLHTKLLQGAAGVGSGTTDVVVSRDGREYPVEERVSAILDANGKGGGFVLCLRDVTERRQAEAAIAEQREWLGTTLVSIGDAVFATDIHGRVSFMNPVAEHLTGWSSDEAAGRDSGEVFRIVNEYTRTPVESPVSKVLREGAIVGLANHTLLLARDGRELPIDDSAAPIRNLEGRITGVVVVFHDVADRRRAEVERQNAEREREQLLQSERAARTEAERASRLKDQFLATVSHELRTPLSAILGWAEIMRRNGHDEASLARGLQVIERNARIQAQLVSDLLDVSRIVSGKMNLELSLVRLQAIVEQALETVRTAADAKHIRLEHSVDQNVDAIAGDPDRLQQIVWNLLSNAVKFTPEGGTVGIRLERSGDRAMITVYDSGVGITPDFLPHLFDRFRQADSSASRRHGGLGLGLTIVKQLVELHGGTVSAQSAGPGSGATFFVRLPLDAAEGVHAVADGAPRASVAPSVAAAKTQRLQGLRVLVVDDDNDGRDLVTRLLSDAGCNVTATPSARAALDALRVEPQDLLVSDIGLPDQDGYSLLAEIRQSEDARIAYTPAIALTAFARPEDRARALRAGFQAHLAKPIDVPELLATVTSLAALARRSPTRDTTLS